MQKQETLTGLTIEEFLDELGSGSAAPGGGSTAALGGAAGASLISMVCHLTLGKKKYFEVEEEIYPRNTEVCRGKTEVGLRYDDCEEDGAPF